MKALLFIPTYNCALQISRVLQRLVQKSPADFFEILVIDNRSKDGTAMYAKTTKDVLGFQNLRVVVNVENYGLGGTQKVAFEYAEKNSFDFVAILHGDDQGDAADLGPMLRLLQSDIELDAVLGNRFSKESIVSGYSLLRIWGNRALNLVYSVVLFRRVRDLGAGVNVYRVSSLRKLDYRRFQSSCDFNFYMLIAAYQAKWKISFQPIIWREEDQVSNANAFRMGIKAIRALCGMFCSPQTVLEPIKDLKFEEI